MKFVGINFGQWRSALLISYLLFLFVLLLSPFKFVPRNGAEISGGLLFAEPGIIQTIIPPVFLHRALVTKGEFSIVVVAQSLQTAPGSRNWLQRIFSYSGGCCDLRNFTIAQDSTSLLVSVRSDGVSVTTRVPNVFETTGVQHIVVTHGSEKRRVYVNGDMKQTSPGGLFRDWVPTYNIIFGNEATGEFPWLGRINRVSVFDRVLSPQEVDEDGLCSRDDPEPEVSPCTALGPLVSYNFEMISTESQYFGEGLYQPSRLALARERILLALVLDYDLTSARSVLEVVGNIILLVPIGILLMGVTTGPGWPKSHLVGILAVVAIVFPFVVAIEFAQAFLVFRQSSVADVIHNMSGVAIGGSIRRLCGSRALPCTP